MNTEAINIKIDPKTKKEAQKLAKDLGFSLSSLLKGYLHHFIKTKTIHFSANDEEPSEYLLEMLRQSDADIAAGRVIEFKNPKDELRHIQKLIADHKRKTNK